MSKSLVAITTLSTAERGRIVTALEAQFPGEREIYFPLRQDHLDTCSAVVEVCYCGQFYLAQCRLDNGSVINSMVVSRELVSKFWLRWR